MFGLVVAPIVLRIIAIVSVVLALLGGIWYVDYNGYQKGFKEAESIARAQMDEYVASQRKAIDKIISENRIQEEALAARILQNQTEKEIEIQAINDHHQRLVDSLRRRPSRSPNKPTPDKNPTAPAAVCPREDSTGTGLSREDGEFLVGEAAAADTLRKALAMCREAYQSLLEPK